MDYKVRSAKKEDFTAIQDVVYTSWHDTYEGIIPRDIQDEFLNSSYSNKTMQQRIEYSHLYVVESDKRIEGFANFSLCQKRASVYCMRFICTRIRREREWGQSCWNMRLMNYHQHSSI